MNPSQDLVQNLKRMAQEVSEREGCKLYDLEFVEARPRILRIYICRLNESNQDVVSVDDCANVSRGLNLLLDVEDVIPGGAYELEVSSPGLERKLTEPWHFETVIGQVVKIQVSEPLPLPENYSGKGTDFRQIQGVLKLVSETEMRVEKDEVEWVVPRADVTKAQVVFVMEAKSKHPHKNGSKNKNKKR